MNHLTTQQVRAHAALPRHLTLWWLGQAACVVKTPGGQVAAPDPYLTNSCRAMGERSRVLRHGEPSDWPESPAPSASMR